MQLVTNGTLYDRIQSSLKPFPIRRWMQQLTEAAAFVDSFGYAHCDIQPANIVCDDEDRLKLIDFDHASRIGEPLDVGYEPYVTQAWDYDPNAGSFGIAGPSTEQFALGSIFWYFTRGEELYKELEGPELVNRLMNSQFPALEANDAVDQVIDDCWH